MDVATPGRQIESYRVDDLGTGKAGVLVLMLSTLGEVVNPIAVFPCS